MLEEETKPIIDKNYYTEKLFWFELDKKQTKRLVTLFLSSPLPKSMPPPAAWKRNTFNLPSSSHVNKTAYEEHSNAFAPRKKWSDLLKPSSAVNIGEVLEPQKVFNPSASDCSDMWWKLASSSDVCSELPVEACYGAATDESDSCVVECWEDNAFVYNNMKQIVENIVQDHDGDSDRPNLAVMEASENTAFLDGWGEFQPSEFDSVQAEEPREAFVDIKEILEPREPSVDDKSVLSEGVLTDVQSFDFQSMITKVLAALCSVTKLLFSAFSHITNTSFYLIGLFSS